MRFFLGPNNGSAAADYFWEMTPVHAEEADGAGLHPVADVADGCRKKSGELIRRHLARGHGELGDALAFGHVARIGNIIRRVGEYDLRLIALHQCEVRLNAGGVSADKSMLPAIQRKPG